MKVSLNLAQEFSNVDLKSIPREELLRRIGAQLGAVEDVIDWAPKFEGAVIVRVVECEKHPNADKLNVCRIDDGGKNPAVERGEDGLIQVVCGAPNVRAGMYAVWLGPGVTVPASRDTDPFVLEAREIRGVVSNGMMASAAELGISDDHSGIVDVTAEDAGKEPVPGEPLTGYFGLDDFVVDCENKMFTHRPDCFGNLGVARELAGISGLKFESPDWYKEPEARIDGPFSDLPFESRCETKLVPRFLARVVEGVAVKPSPLWLQVALARVGIKSINNIVDWTNYYMHLTGQPTHAFDYDKIKALSGETPTIFPRMAQKGEKLTLLGGKTIGLDEGDIVIATDKQPVALAGIMGGADTEVDENTKNIIIEAATFDMYSIRRSSMRHGLFTDASNRFNKGQSPYQNARVLYKLVNDIVDQTGARPGKMANFIDCDAVDPSEVGFANEVQIQVDFINERLGSNLGAEEIAALLNNVEFVVSVEGQMLTVQVPFWRMDIEIPEDIVEEIGRLYGYDKLPVNLPSRSAKPTPRNELFEFKQQLRENLVKSGANEVLTYSFVHGDLLRKTGTNPDETAYHLRNAISPDLQYYRTSLIPSLLQKVHPNIKAQAGDANNQFALFEVGKTHVKGRVGDDGLPEELQHLALVVAADEKTAKARQAGAAYYLAKKYLDTLTNGQATYEPIKSFDYPMTAVYAEGRSAVVKLRGELIGVVGEFNAKARAVLKLPAFTAGFEIDIERLQQHQDSTGYKPLPRFPEIDQDITLTATDKATHQQMSERLAGRLQELSAPHGYEFALFPGTIFAPEGSSERRMTFRVRLSHPDRTLTGQEAAQIIEQCANV